MATGDDDDDGEGERWRGRAMASSPCCRNRDKAAKEMTRKAKEHGSGRRLAVAAGSVYRLNGRASEKRTEGDRRKQARLPDPRRGQTRGIL